MRRDLGDFQTPPALVEAVLDVLGPVGDRWPRVLEPTCGRGHFLAGLLGRSTTPRELIGIECQEGHAEEARIVARGAGSSRVEVLRASLFDVDLRTDLRWKESGPLLIVGNPPWVTNSELGLLGSENRPRRSNVDGLRGIDARTGASNFDIAEAIWRKLLVEVAKEPEGTTIALLCKVATARRVLEFAARTNLAVVSAELFPIAARVWFGAMVEACLLRVTLGGRSTVSRVPVRDDLNAGTLATEMGFARGLLVPDLTTYQGFAFADGACRLTWRQGLKHDAAPVMELERASADEPYRNKRGEPVDVEPDHIYPLLKGADLARPPARPRRAVIVTQRRIGQDTRSLERSVPRLWAYLQAHAATFSLRKSSIYRGQPPFAIFGIGPYSFVPYKVAISGLHKSHRFRAVGPVEGRPVMLDDTGYFLPCSGLEQAAFLTALLNEPASLGLMESLIFGHAKRPVTKALLQRIDLQAVFDHADRPALLARAEEECRRLDGRAPRWPVPLDVLLEPAPDATLVH